MRAAPDDDELRQEKDRKTETAVRRIKGIRQGFFIMIFLSIFLTIIFDRARQ
jgi:hypothetical protein